MIVGTANPENGEIKFRTSSIRADARCTWEADYLIHREKTAPQYYLLDAAAIIEIC